MNIKLIAKLMFLWFIYIFISSVLYTLLIIFTDYATLMIVITINTIIQWEVFFKPMFQEVFKK